jgi:uracil-DNA glycosylase family 4
MEDAAPKLAQLACSVTECELCQELVATRRRAVPGGGHAHAHVMMVAAAPTEREEAAGLPAGSGLLDEFADMLVVAAPERRAPIYTTALVKCVPREAQQPRAARSTECDNCYGYLSREISTITPHVLVPVGAQAAAYVLARLLGDGAPAFDPLNLRVIRTPAFSVAPVPSPPEVSALPPHERKACLEQLQTLAARIHL